MGAAGECCTSCLPQYASSKAVCEIVHSDALELLLPTWIQASAAAVESGKLLIVLRKLEVRGLREQKTTFRRLKLVLLAP